MPPTSAPRSSPVSARRYMVRRTAAAVVVVALVAGGFSGARALLDGDDDPAVVDEDVSGSSRTETTVTAATTSESTGTSGSATVSSRVEVSAASTADTATMTIPATSPDDEPGSGDEVPTAESPARVYIAGDSDAGTFGPYLQELLDDVPEAETQLDYKVSSGLSRPDFFDWPARFAEAVPAYDPDIVIVTFGGNDAQGLTEGPQGASPDFVIGGPVDDQADWEEEYGRRVGEVMDLLSADGRTLIWVGIPNHRTPVVSERMEVQDQVVRAQAGDRPDVVFIDTWERFSGRNGGFAQYVVDPRDGEGKSVRSGDGFHLNEVGAEILALDIATAVRDDLSARGIEL
ncbi:MAG: DUF459 domain-containing protein [Acidimicrobiia bacterium]|nr:DUF459 domain-containing protein [Acidimicrobiia bacterium]